MLYLHRACARPCVYVHVSVRSSVGVFALFCKTMPVCRSSLLTSTSYCTSTLAATHMYIIVCMVVYEFPYLFMSELTCTCMCHMQLPSLYCCVSILCPIMIQWNSNPSTPAVEVYSLLFWRKSPVAMRWIAHMYLYSGWLASCNSTKLPNCHYNDVTLWHHMPVIPAQHTSFSGLDIGMIPSLCSIYCCITC